MRQPRAAEAFRLLRGDHEALVRTARRRTQVLLHRGDPTAALVVVDEALTNLPDDGTLPPEVHADLRLQLLADRSAALGALAEEIYRGPRPVAVSGRGRRHSRCCSPAPSRP